MMCQSGQFGRKYYTYRLVRVVGWPISLALVELEGFREVLWLCLLVLIANLYQPLDDSHLMSRLKTHDLEQGA